MSDQSYRHSLDDHDEVLSVQSQDIVEVISKGPIESPVTRESTDAERAELYKHMAFEADKEVKRLQAKVTELDYQYDMKSTELRYAIEETKKVRLLARQADDELAVFQGCMRRAYEHINADARNNLPMFQIDNARAALTKALEGWE